MKTKKNRFEVNYIRGTEGADPKIRVALYLSLLTLLKLLFFSLMGQPQIVWYYLTDVEISSLSEAIIGRQIVKNLRHYKSRARKK